MAPLGVAAAVAVDEPPELHPPDRPEPVSGLATAHQGSAVLAHPVHGALVVGQPGEELVDGGVEAAMYDHIMLTHQLSTVLLEGERPLR